MCVLLLCIHTCSYMYMYIHAYNVHTCTHVNVKMTGTWSGKAVKESTPKHSFCADLATLSRASHSQWLLWRVCIGTILDHLHLTSCLLLHTHREEDTVITLTTGNLYSHLECILAHPQYLEGLDHFTSFPCG